MTVSSSSIESLSEKERTATSSVTNLQFSAGDSEGIIYKAQALFEVYNREQPTTKIPGVTLLLVNQLTDLMQTIETDKNGNYTLTDVQTGKYTLFVTQAPAGYIIPDAYLSGKEIQLTRNDNQFSIGLTQENDLSSVGVKNSSLYVGESWHAEDNFVSATDRTGAPLALSDLTVTGTVDSSRPGRYEVNYQNGSVHAVAIVTVISDKTTIVTKDTTIYAGDTWQAEDNFVSATDKTGSQRLLSDLTVTGTVDSNQVGSYDVTYQNDNVSAVATIKVIAKVLEPDKQTDQGDKGKSSMSTVTESKVEKLPQTGDKDSRLIVMIGLLAMTYITWFISKKRE
nr:bacterial Ig-like domain-containing protein [Lactococcus carnosus]